VRSGVEVVAIGRPKPRQILAMLVTAHGGVVATDRLYEELWGDDQPADPDAVLQSKISQLRRLLDPGARIARSSASSTKRCAGSGLAVSFAIPR
jgi:DNA-binding winged helix-turn-helix (wHTH) protein